jgi:hypothetical protein
VGELIARVWRECLAEIVADEREKRRAREARRRPPVGERQPARLGDDAAVVLGAQRAEVIERRRGDGRALGPRLGRLVWPLRPRALHAPAVAVDQHVGEVVGIVVDLDPAAAQMRLDDEGDAVDLDGHRLRVRPAADTHAEGLGDEDGIGIARGEVERGEAPRGR